MSSLDWMKEQMTRDLILDRKLNQTKEKIEYVHQVEDTKYQLLHEHTLKLEQSLATERQALEVLTETKSAEVMLLECEFQLKLALEKQARADFEATSVQGTDSRILPLVVDVAKLAERRGEMQKRCVEQVANDLKAFGEAVDRESRQREEDNAQMERDMRGRLEDLGALIMIQQKVREESEVSILQTFKDASERILRDINMERRDREEGEKAFLRVMEGILARYGIYARNLPAAK